MASEYTPAGQPVAFTVPDYADVADGPKLAKDIADDVAANYSRATKTETITNKTLGSNLAAGSFKITGLADSTNAQDAATKNYVDTAAASQVALATTQATNAATSASGASTSATAAAASAATASTQASNASGSATTSTTQASNASTSAGTATTQATNAATSASGASTSATNAAASAATATTQASNASSSATNAASSASASASSASSASSSAASAASALDSFDDRYLGPFSSQPALDNDGNALLQGALFYLNTGSTEVKGMYVYDGASWIKASAAAQTSIVTYEYTATASQTVFSGADLNSVSMTFTAGLIQVFLNGVLLNPGDDYASASNAVTLVSGAAVGDSLTVVAFASFNVANTYTQAQTYTQAEVNTLIAVAAGGGAGYQDIFLLMGA